MTPHPQRRRPKSIPDAYACALAAARLHTPGGVLSEPQRAHLIRATARDAGVTVDAVRAWLEVQHG